MGAISRNFGKKDVPAKVFIERTEDAIETKAEVIATACPFCMTMLDDGVKQKEKTGEIRVFDLAELVASAENLK